VAVGDLIGDGSKDIATANVRTSTVSVFLSQSVGNDSRGDEIYAAVLRSEWRVAMDWTPPKT